MKLLCVVLVTIVQISSYCAGESQCIWGFVTFKQKQSLKRHGFFLIFPMNKRFSINKTLMWVFIWWIYFFVTRRAMNTMDEQKNIPETGCHRNCARRAARHRIECTFQSWEEEVILKLLFSSVLGTKASVNLLMGIFVRDSQGRWDIKRLWGWWYTPHRTFSRRLKYIKYITHLLYIYFLKNINNDNNLYDLM